jgi:cell division protein FtsI/penicillin-binding protein 2
VNETENRNKPRRRPATNRYQFQGAESPELVEKVSRQARPEPRIRISSQPSRTAASSDSYPKKASEQNETPRRTWRLSSTMRVRLAMLVIVLIAATLVIRLFALQATQQGPYGDLKKRATAQHLSETTIPARRGIIRDANGLVLASNISLYQIWGAPQSLTEKQSQKSIAALTQLLPNVQPAKIKDALTYTSKDKIYNLIASAIDSTTADKISNLALPGVYLEPQTRRFYPNGDMMGRLIGFANYENVGAYGVEGYYDEKYLRGKPGLVIAERDADGNPIAISQQKEIEAPQDGADLTLTIDSTIQVMVERELKSGMEKHQAESAVAIVMDPQTGAILAWASYPNYNPNDFYKTDGKLLKDAAVSDLYEPGSTFKILTAAIGIDTGVVTPDSSADLPGCVIKYGQRICNFDSVGYQHQTVVDTLIHSSNVGAMWIAEKFGPQKYYDYLKRFGIGSLTGIDVQGEAPALLRWPDSKDWSPLDMLTNSFGQSVAVTPVQLVTAVSAVANGGKLMKPYVVSKVVRDGQVISETKPEVIRQVIKPESAKTTTEMLIQAVRKGETRLADVSGYRIAGKTGTATLYDSPLTIGSTIAYAPADNPRFVVYVRYDKTKDTPWGSNTAAPVVATIMQNLFSQFNIPPTEPVDPKKKP